MTVTQRHPLIAEAPGTVGAANLRVHTQEVPDVSAQTWPCHASRSTSLRNSGILAKDHVERVGLGEKS